MTMSNNDTQRAPCAFERGPGVWDHDIFRNEPFTEREAWRWLIDEASDTDRQFYTGKAFVNLKRGQLARSLRSLADAWQWGKNGQNKVDRFLKRLQSAALIEADAGAGVMVITILYQTRGN